MLTFPYNRSVGHWPQPVHGDYVILSRRPFHGKCMSDGTAKCTMEDCHPDMDFYLVYDENYQTETFLPIPCILREAVLYIPFHLRESFFHALCAITLKRNISVRQWHKRVVGVSLCLNMTSRTTTCWIGSSWLFDCHEQRTNINFGYIFYCGGEILVPITGKIH